jgi:glycosyltransferase involved in cell wall biosynthesis
MASGVPMVQPALGAFPEVIETCGGGVIYGENKPEILAEKLKELIFDDARLQQLSNAGINGVKAHFDIHAQAWKMVAVYENVLNS